MTSATVGLPTRGSGNTAIMRWGYTCSSEEFDGSSLVGLAKRAEDEGFEFVTVSDHFHPWVTTQGHSPFAWSTLGGIAATSDQVALGTGVSCPLEHAGTYYRVENARLFSRPVHDIEVVWAASGPESAALAAEHGDAMWCTSPDESLVQAYRDGGGEGRVIGQMTICWAEDEATARRTALQQWPTAAIGGQLSQDLPTWTHFEAATELAGEDDVAATVVCGPDQVAVVEMAQRYARAGVTDLHVHQVGPDQEAFFAAWSRGLRGALESVVS